MVVPMNNGITFSNKMELAIDIGNNVHEFQNNYTNLESHSSPPQENKAYFMMIHLYKFLKAANQNKMTEKQISHWLGEL